MKKGEIKMYRVTLNQSHRTKDGYELNDNINLEFEEDDDVIKLFRLLGKQDVEIKIYNEKGEE